MSSSGGLAPEVSIVVPFYGPADDMHRRLAFLDECLRSLQAQTLSRWEAIVVDDGSQDAESVQALIEVKRDGRIRYVRHDVNRGLGAARNTGFKSAVAQLVLPLDSDDRLRPMFLDRTRAFLTSHTDIDCVFTYFQVFGNSDSIRCNEVRPWPEILRAQWIPGPGTVMWRRVWETAGGYAELLDILGNEDWDFWIAALSRGVRAASIAEPLYEYREWSGSLTFRYPPQDGHVARQAIYERHRAIFRSERRWRGFLAGGYLNSASAARRTDRRAIALGLAARGLAVTPWNLGLWRQMALSPLSGSMERTVRTWCVGAARGER